MANICSVTHKLTATDGMGTTTGTGTAYINYSISDQPDKAVVTAKVVITAQTNTTPGSCTTRINASTSSWQINGVQTVLPAGSITGGTTLQSKELGAASVTINKTHSAQNVSASGYYKMNLEVQNGYGARRQVACAADNPATTIAISAKTSYTISYNANGGSGAPAAQTKWYGETLKLQTGTPTRTGWTFKGWATTSTATTAAYAAGANYTGNATATLYAVWQRNTYTVSYNANGGTGAPANQTKQYGIDLTLSSTVPSFSGWTFKGWATSTANASAGTVNYAKGATYTGNTALTLYAVWELTYKKPTISNVRVDRCVQSGDLEDDGDCSLVTADLGVFKSSLPRYYGGNTYPYADNAVAQDGYVVSVTDTSFTETRTPTEDLYTAYQVVIGNGFDPDAAYGITISLTDSQGIVSDHTTTATGTLPAQFFPMDYNADATAVGFFMPAPKSGTGDGAYFGKDIHIYIDTATASGTDAAINQALTKLGWTDVLE